ncbi:MFS transporter [Planotetraspora silvatica]|uniref:MFS transporter n=1 Tax=Planotetraspora silvatica TaxID=234614 RepID=A0A8J3XRA0_9ACTN|nr:MFS transporter [Planotetraspora silvatica]GII50164.1 MFS transporter [Planotetraspora silvatica]
MTDTPPPGHTARWSSFAVLSAVQLMIIIDGGVVNIALPSVQGDLGFTQAGLAWVVNAYMIAFAGLLLLSGRLGDLVGRRHMFVAGLLTFVAASLICGLSPTSEILVAGRFLQGAGGAMAAAVAMGITMTLFTEPRAIAKALSWTGAIAAAGGTIGGVAGGVITQTAGWRWVFFVNVPIGLVVAVLAVRLLASDRGIGLRAGADGAGALLITAGLMLGVYTIVTVDEHGWRSAHTAVPGAVAVVLLAGFAVRQATAARPLLPPRVLRSRDVAGANLVQVLMVAAITGFGFLSVLYLRLVLGYDAMATSLASLPLPVTLAAVSLGVSARLNTRVGPRAVLAAGLVLIVAGLCLAARAPAAGAYVMAVLPMMTLVGAGVGLAMPAVMTLAMSTVTPADAGVTSGLTATSAQAGGALGLAVLAALATARTESLPAGGRTAAAALNEGYHLAFGTGALLAAAALVMSLILLVPGSRPRRPAAITSPDDEPSGVRSRS